MKTTIATHIAVLVASLPLAVCAAELIFQSGFENNVQVVNQTSRDCDIVGADYSLAAPNDWVDDLEGHPRIGNFKINYEEGDQTERLARIIDDPTDQTNKVLQFWLHKPNVTIPSGKKSRIQSNFYNNSGLREFSFQVRVYFSTEWTWLRDSDSEMGWFLCSEYWNNANWSGENYPFRFNLHIEKHIGASANTLFFMARGQIWDNSANSWGERIWVHENRDFSIPLEEWFTLRAYVKEGDAATGRYVLEAIRADGTTTTVFDLTEPTHNPANPSPDGFRHLNLIKAYGSSSNLDYVRTRGGTLQVLWDDFRLWEGEHPAPVSTATDGGAWTVVAPGVDGTACVLLTPAGRVLGPDAGRIISVGHARGGSATLRIGGNSGGSATLPVIIRE